MNKSEQTKTENSGKGPEVIGKRAPIGRPRAYSPEVAAVILERLTGGESLRHICKDPDLPSRSTVTEWISSLPEFSGQYARARTLQLDIIADEILAIADDTSGDIIRTEDEEGIVTERVDYENIHRARLRVDARKWLLSKLRPEIYGDRIAHNVTTHDGDLAARLTAARKRAEALPTSAESYEDSAQQVRQ